MNYVIKKKDNSLNQSAFPDLNVDERLLIYGGIGIIQSNA